MGHINEGDFDSIHANNWYSSARKSINDPDRLWDDRDVEPDWYSEDEFDEPEDYSEFPREELPDDDIDDYNYEMIGNRLSGNEKTENPVKLTGREKLLKKNTEKPKNTGIRNYVDLDTYRRIRELVPMYRKNNSGSKEEAIESIRGVDLSDELSISLIYYLLYAGDFKFNMVRDIEKFKKLKLPIEYDPRTNAFIFIKDRVPRYKGNQLKYYSLIPRISFDKFRSKIKKYFE